MWRLRKIEDGEDGFLKFTTLLEGEITDVHRYIKKHIHPEAYGDAQVVKLIEETDPEISKTVSKWIDETAKYDIHEWLILTAYGIDVRPTILGRQVLETIYLLPKSNRV